MDLIKSKNASYRFNIRASAEKWNAYCKPDLNFCNPALNDLLARWDLKARSGLPKRSDFPPNEMKGLLKFASIIEKTGERDNSRWYFRLLGSSLSQMLGELTGKYLDEVFSGEFSERWSFLNECALSGEAHLRFVTHYKLPRISYLSGQSLILPLADENGDAKFLLNCTYVRSQLNDLPAP